MNPISAAVPNPTPKPDREIVPANANGDAPQQGTGRESAFGTVLRELSGTGPASPAKDDAAKAKPDDAEGDAVPEATVAAPAAPGMPAGSAAALVADLLRVAAPPALTAASSESATATRDRPAAAPTVPGTGSLSASALGSTGAPVREPSSGSASALAGSVDADPPHTNEATRADGPTSTDEATHADEPARRNEPAPTDGPTRADGLTRADRPTHAEGPTHADVAKVLRAAAGNVAVLGRAVHFQPVVAGGAPAPEPASAGPAEPAGPALGVLDPQGTRSALPALNAAAALKLQPPVRSEPDPRRAATAIDAEAGPQKPAGIAPAPGRVVSGVERAVLASIGEHAEDAAASAGSSRDGTGTATSLPAGSLPMIATAIREELERATAAAAAQGRIHADPTAGGVPDGPLRVLKIQLRPEDLGVVTVEMRLSNGQLETHLRASQPETAALLHKDAAILTDLLSHSSYQAEVTVGQARPAEASTASGGSQSQASPSFADGGARPGNEGARQRQDAQRQAGNRREGERTDEAVRPRDGGIYL
ncbi:flagellar hook-length control protein FliK [Methylobacterium sp. WL7]|uniref:flagellar hook-length control protein FliK n=1 Tax=Methylobacterium sp. WL7 TaxID=2603900 RepID=UPI0011CAD1AC|nr:flagellar hook-length control protein FliK [Methylobacterium sp. WL7]TXN42403.1 flagellar hook-length control protein FliK [Methylobacterium sp. WL7]